MDRMKPVYPLSTSLNHGMVMVKIIATLAAMYFYYSIMHINSIHCNRLCL